MGCDEAVLACSPPYHGGYSHFIPQICDSQIMTAPSSTSLIIQQQNQTLTELIRDVFFWEQLSTCSCTRRALMP